MRPAGLSASIIQKPKDGEDRKIVTFVRWWPPFYDSDGPGEALNGSVRPRGRSLRPDGVRTVPTADLPISRGREGVKASKPHKTDAATADARCLPRLHCAHLHTIASGRAIQYAFRACARAHKACALAHP